MPNYIFLDIRLDALKEFLDRVTKHVDAEVSDIFSRNDAGEFPGIDDFGNALFYPRESEAIAIRAIFYEINALVESELHDIANEPYLNHPKSKKGKKFLDGITSIDDVSQLRLVSDLSFGEVCKLIEDYYGIVLRDLPAFESLQSVRESVNSFKHNMGFKDFRKYPNSNFPERFKLKREDAYKAISEVKIFIRALWHKTGK
jgi:hypothetical protein